MRSRGTFRFWKRAPSFTIGLTFRFADYIRIQIYTAITTYCMIAIVQKKMSIERSIYEMLQLVSISLTETICLKDLFAKPNCNIVNELDGSTEPTLF